MSRWAPVSTIAKLFIFDKKKTKERKKAHKPIPNKLILKAIVPSLSLCRFLFGVWVLNEWRESEFASNSLKLFIVGTQKST